MGQPSSIRLVFWVELGPRPLYVLSFGRPGHEGRRFMGIASRARSAVHSNKWYHSPWSKKPKKFLGHMVMGDPVTVSVVTRDVCDMEHWTRGLENVF